MQTIEYTKLTFDDFVYCSETEDYRFGADMSVRAAKWCAELVREGAEPVCAIDFYQDVFKEYLEPHREKGDYRVGEYGGIALQLWDTVEDGGKKKSHAKRTTVTRELTELFDIIDTSEHTCFIAPMSYVGLHRKNDYCRYMFALCVELDGIQPKNGIRELFFTWQRKNMPLPEPTYIIASGSGLHLYWVFKQPIPMYKNLFAQWSTYKKELTRRLWDKPETYLYDHVQYESLNQPFRIPGTRTKSGARALAFKVGGEVTPEYMNQFVHEEYRVETTVKSTLTLAEAAEKYPDWYQRRIINGEPRRFYNRHEGIYYNWIEKIMKGGEVGHRYNCLENLCSLAVQCKIPREQLVEDCMRVAEYFETLTNDDNNHFTQYDVNCALRTYDNPNETAYLRRLDVVEHKCNIRLYPNRRNGRTQKEHLWRARILQTADYPNGEWRNKNGAPTKKAIVKKWREEHPQGRKIDCQRDTGLSRPTVLKWWDD